MEKIRIGIGIDCGCKNLQCSISSYVEDNFKELSNKKFDNCKAGFMNIEEWIKRHTDISKADLVLLVEVTGVYHEQLLSYFYDKGYHISVMMGSRVKSYFKFKGYESKTDKEDARGLSMMVCEYKLLKWEPASKELLEIRTLMRLRKAVTDDKTRLSNRHHALLRSTVPASYAKKSLKLSITQKEKEIKKIERQVRILVNKNEELSSKINKIVSIPGLGFNTVVTVIAETNGFAFCTSMKQLESYAGFNVVENKSGIYEGKSKISKRGNAYLRSCLFMSSLSIVKHKYKPLYDLYSRINTRNGWTIKGKGLVAIQRKLLLLIYTLWKNDSVFDKAHEKKKNMPALEPA